MGGECRVVRVWSCGGWSCGGCRVVCGVYESDGIGVDVDCVKCGGVRMCMVSCFALGFGVGVECEV